MSVFTGEPLQPWVLERLQATQAKANRIRMVDMPAVSKDNRVGAPVAKPRPAILLPLIELPVEITGTCPHCNRTFKGKKHQRYCNVTCYRNHVKADFTSCARCNQTFKKRHAGSRYCSRTCYQAHWAETCGERMRALAIAARSRAEVDEAAVDRIAGIVAETFRLKRRDLGARVRFAPVVRPRQVAMSLACKLLNASLKGTGQYFDRDHSTVAHALRACEKRIQKNARFAALYAEAESRCRAALASRQAEGA